MKMNPMQCNCCLSCSTGISYYWGKHQYIYNMIQIIVANNILRYQQCISQVFSQSDISINLASFSAVFNLSFYDIYASSKAENGWCFIKGMTAKDEVLSGFILIATMFGLLCMIRVLISIIERYCCFFEINILGRSLYFGKTFVAL